jgi:DNA-binding CsgD family transcriptional regulator
VASPRTADELLAQIPRERFAAYLRPLVSRMIRDMIAEIQSGVPAYRKPLEGKFGKVLVTGVERAVLRVVDCLGKAEPIDKSAWEEWFRYAGRIEFREGRSMDSLQAAVRIGSRVGWRHLRAGGVALGIPTEILMDFADALFTYSDELCTVALAGYTQAQTQASGTIERRRQQLLKLLISDAPSSPQTIADLARASSWTVPEQVAVIALEYRQDQHQNPPSGLPQHVLVDLESTEPCLVMADPQEHLDLLGKELNGRRAAVGPLVPVEQAHRSLAAARRALVLAARGVLPDGDIVQCADHLTTLALCADEFLLTHLTENALRPLDGLTVKQRERLSETLLTWLGARGGVNEIAERLDIHPQTVRYRMNQINELFGTPLNDPDQRLRLEIALRATRLLHC